MDDDYINSYTHTLSHDHNIEVVVAIKMRQANVNSVYKWTSTVEIINR